MQNSILADEFKRAMADVQIGVSDWQTALSKLASQYEIDSLSDFVLDITNAYKNGSSIEDSLLRQSHDIKASNLLLAKEKASKLSNIILVPVMVFKIFPLILLMCIPVISQLNANGFF